MGSDFLIGVGNPAVEYCLEMGGDAVCGGYADEQDVCLCKWPDGSEADLWAYARGEVEPAFPEAAPEVVVVQAGMSPDLAMALFAGLGIVSLILLGRTTR